MFSATVLPVVRLLQGFMNWEGQTFWSMVSSPVTVVEHLSPSGFP